MGKQGIKISSCLQPKPNVLVSCKGANGEENALAVAYCGNCSFDPPMLMVGIVPSRYSYHMVKETGCFVVNLVTKDFQEQFKYLGGHSRRDEDKLTVKGIKTAPGVKVNAPILTDCPVNIECKVVDSIMTGSHEMFVGRIEYVHADPAVLDANENIDFSMLDLL